MTRASGVAPRAPDAYAHPTRRVRTRGEPLI